MSGTLGSGTTYLEGAVLGHTLGFANWPMPAAGVFVGLCTSQPSAGTPGAEVAGNGYSRRGAVFAIGASPNLAVNQASIEFPAATGYWGVIGWFEIWDALSAGNRLYQGTLVDPTTGAPVTREVEGGDILRLTAGTLAVRAF